MINRRTASKTAKLHKQKLNKEFGSFRFRVRVCFSHRLNKRALKLEHVTFKN